MTSENNALHPRDIVSAYADLLAAINENQEHEALKIIPNALPESLLPFPLTTIRHALAIYLLHQNFRDRRDAIEDAYLYLDNFIPDEEYSLFHSLQDSMSTKEKLSNIENINTLDMMNRLRLRTQTIKMRKEESIEELNALRRIMDLPDDISDSYLDQADCSQEEVQELRLNL